MSKISLKLKPKLIVAFLLVGLVPFLIIGILTLNKSQDALEFQAFNQLQSVRGIKKAQIEQFFAERQGDMGVLMETVGTLRNESMSKLSSVLEARKSHISDYFKNLASCVQITCNNSTVINALQRFQFAFENSGNTVSAQSWKNVDQQSGSQFKKILDQMGYYDIFLISDKGDVVYSVTKEADLGQNVISGALSSSGLGIAVKKAQSNKVGFSDFSPYAPSNGAPAAFMASALLDENGNRAGGYIAIQAPLQQVNDIMLERHGLGKTGEAYLVGSDYLMRSDSFLDPKHHTVEASFSDPEKGRAETEATRNALSGKTGTDIVIDYNGNPVLSAYAPLEIFGVKWAILAEMDVSEAFVPIDENGNEFFKKYIELYGYYDLFVMNPDGYVFYTASKEADYQTNMVDGKYKDSGLGKLTRKVIEAKKFGIADFAPYAPSNDDPAAFIAQPVTHGSKVELVVALQLSLDSINSVMQQRDGMGKTGETYLVGSDKLMRSDSFLDATNHSVKASFANPEKGSVKTTATEKALAGETGAEIITDYNGNSVLSAFAPLTVGDTTWALIAEIDEAEAFVASNEIKTMMFILAGVGVLVISGIGYLIGNGVAKPIIAMTGVMGSLAKNDLTVDVPYAERADEIGDMAGSVGHFKDQLIRVRQLEVEQEEQKKIAEEQRRAAMHQMADSFEASVGKVVQTVTSAATELEAASGQMAATATETSTQATTVASAAEEATVNVQTVASATEQLSGSINEISAQVNRSTSVADQATEEAINTTQSIQALSDQVGQIGEIVKLINDIADQTNLLALNATIEAARAGDAGKGFAVVASEVKNLANQTAKATEQIGSQISAIQKGTETAVGAIRSISGVINEMSEISSSVASAVEEQTAATGEIAKNIEQAAIGTGEVSSNIGGVEHAARDTGAAAEQIKSSSGDLSKQAEFLREEVARFLDQVRSDKKDMKLLEWDDSLACGDHDIDNHHKEIIDDLNIFYSEMMFGEGGAAAIAMMRKIETGMRDHFASEERHMSQIGYPGLSGHKKLHNDFLTKFAEAKRSIETNDKNGTTEFFNFVSTWLKDHIFTQDRSFAQFELKQKVA